MNLTKRQIQNALIQSHRKVYGNNVFNGVNFEATPKAVQVFVQKVRESSPFLNAISITLTTEAIAEILSLDEGQSVGQRTHNSEQRRPIEMGGFTGRKWSVKASEADVVFLWETMLQWGVNSSLVNRLYRERLVRSRGMSIERKGLYGQSYNPLVSSDLTTYPMMEDVQKGFLHYVIENAPNQVLGISESGTDPRGYEVNAINLGEGGDFISMVQLVDFLRNEMLDSRFRNLQTNRAIIGESLASHDLSAMIKMAGNTPTERESLDAIKRLTDTLGA